jgi:hypothetical protein
MYNVLNGERLSAAQGNTIAIGKVNTATLTSPQGIPNPGQLRWQNRARWLRL